MPVRNGVGGKKRDSTNLVFLHHSHAPLKIIPPSTVDLLYEAFLEACDSFVRLPNGDKVVPQFGLVVELLAVRSHCASEVAHGTPTLTILEGVAASANPTCVGSCRLLETVHTRVAHGHLGFKAAELFVEGCLGGGAHFLACPLEGAIEFLGEMHDAVVF